MFRGGFEPAPFRLGGAGNEEGITPEQHARMCADLVAMWRSLPLAVVEVDDDGTVLSYKGRNGSGVSAAPTVVAAGSGVYTLTWSNQYPTGYKDEKHNWSIRTASVGNNQSATTPYPAAVTTTGAISVVVSTYRESNSTPTDAAFTLAVYGDFGPDRSIGDYGGSVAKKSDVTEHPIPYAASIYRDLQTQRGSAYSTKTGTLVHAENVAISRLFSATSFRLPDKLQNNASGPLKADEGLEYWARSLKLQQRDGESREAFRARASLHRRLSKGATYDNLRDEISTLLGDAFVGVTLNHDGNFETPPTSTYWPVINPGAGDYDLGGGSWYSERAQIIINAQQPGGMPANEFNSLMNEDLFELVDRLIPAWCTAQWQDEDAVRVVWDGSGVTWNGTGITWDNLFDWNS